MAEGRRVQRVWRGVFALMLPVGVLAGIGGSLAVSGVAGAVGTTLHVATTGTDTGTCTSGAPCKTLGYALSKAAAGDTITLAPGTYKAATDPATTSNTVPPGFTGLTITSTSGKATTTIVTGAGGKNALVVNSDAVTVTHLTFENAGQSGVLVSPATTATPPTEVATDTISANYIVTNDKCATTPTVHAAGATTYCKTPTPESDFGEGLHLMSVETSHITKNDVKHNFGGILVTDELGPNRTNTISTNTASTNVGDCGITLAGHNGTAVHTSGPTVGKPDPTAGGVYNNVISSDTADNNGAAGLLAATPFPGTGVYDNTFKTSTANGNGLPGMTIHSHAPLQDTKGNVVEDDTFKNDALHGGPTFGPGDGTARITQTTGIEVLAAAGATDVAGTVIKSDTVSTVFYGIWLSPGVLEVATIGTNTITVTTGGTALFAEPGPNGGYVMVGKDGNTYAFGNLASHGSVPGEGKTVTNAVGIAETPDGGGYWVATADGTVYPFGDANSYGTLPALHVTVNNVVGIAATPTGGGYWLVASDGGVFGLGNAAFHGSMGGHPLNKPIVGIAANATGTGYWLVASDGGIFAFTVPFHGSMGGIPLNKPVVGMAADLATGSTGYWLVASDGGIFAFTAPFKGSMGGHPLNKPIVGMAANGTGSGYWLVASDGGIFAFTAFFAGSLGGDGVSNVVGMTTNP